MIRANAIILMWKRESLVLNILFQLRSIKKNLNRCRKYLLGLLNDELGEVDVLYYAVHHEFVESC